MTTPTITIQIRNLPPEHITALLQGLAESGACTITAPAVQDCGADAKPKQEDTPLPATLDSDPFRTTWADFVQHRRLIKKPMTPLAMTRLLARCEKEGKYRANAALNMAIERGWQAPVWDHKELERTGGDAAARRTAAILAEATGGQG